MAKKHEEDLRLLHQKLDLYTDSSLNKFKETALVSCVFVELVKLYLYFLPHC